MNKIRISPTTRYEPKNFIDQEIYGLDLKKITLLKLLKIDFRQPLILSKITTKSIDNDDSI